MGGGCKLHSFAKNWNHCLCLVWKFCHVEDEMVIFRELNLDGVVEADQIGV